MSDFAKVLWALAVIAVVVFLFITDGQRKQIKVERAETEKYQALYAEAVTDGVATVETLRLVERRVAYQRDTVLARITDTAYVREYIERVDTLRVLCLSCAMRFDSLRLASDSLISSLAFEKAQWKWAYESSRPNWWDKHKEKVLFVAGVFVGNRLVRP